MDPVAGLGLGFQLALTPTNLLFALVGCLVGTAIGVLPGIGPVSGVAILLPVIFACRVDPTSGMIMLAAVYYGSQYGGSTTSILINTPGESSSVMTCLDGYAMAKKGRAGPALAMAAIASFVAGTPAVLGLMLLAPPLTEFALGFGPHENAALMVLGLTTLTRLAGKSVLKALLMAAFGLLLGTVGIDSMSGTPRFTFGSGALLNGFDFAVVAIGRRMAAAPHVWPAVLGARRDPARRDQHLRLPTGPAPGDRASRLLLGRRRLDVHRQRDAAHPQSAARRGVGEHPADPLRHPAAVHRPVHFDRDVRDQQRHLRHLGDGRVRRARLDHAQVRLPRGARRARARARATTRDQLSPRAHDLAGRLHVVPGAPDRRDAARPRRPLARLADSRSARARTAHGGPDRGRRGLAFGR